MAQSKYSTNAGSLSALLHQGNKITIILPQIKAKQIPRDSCHFMGFYTSGLGEKTSQLQDIAIFPQKFIILIGFMSKYLF